LLIATSLYHATPQGRLNSSCALSVCPLLGRRFFIAARFDCAPTIDLSSTIAYSKVDYQTPSRPRVDPIGIPLSAWKYERHQFTLFS
jgi:hypothetical protein